MLNKNGNTENLKEFHKNGKASYWFVKFSPLGYYHERTYDENGYVLTFKNSNDYWESYTRAENGKELTFKNSVGEIRGFEIPEFMVEETKTKIMLNKNGNTEDSNDYSFEYTYDESGKELTYKDSDGLKTTVEETKDLSESGIPAHYDNDNGSLYLVAEQRGWNPYLFDIVKRLERSGKKGEFESDLNKSKVVIDIWLKESKLKKKDNVK